MKKLKLRIAKFDKLLVVEQLEMTGSFKKTSHVNIEGALFIFANKIDLQESIEFQGSCSRDFLNNEERDDYLQKMLGWITEEQFGGAGKLEIGKPCMVGNEQGIWGERIYAGKVAKQLGTDKRHLARSEIERDAFFRWRYAKPINDCLKIDGEIYTWEVEK